jgi:hypothetical protein
MLTEHSTLGKNYLNLLKEEKEINVQNINRLFLELS